MFTLNFFMDIKSEKFRRFAKRLSIILFSISAFLLVIVILAENDTYKKKKQSSPEQSIAHIGNDSIRKANALCQLSLEERNTLSNFQKRWADSVVKVMNTGEGGFSLVSNKLRLPDSISFEYSEGVTRNGFYANLNVDTVLYRQWYKDAIEKTLGAKYNTYPVHITCIPNRNVNFEEVTKREEAIKTKQAKIAAQFSAWNGAHIKLENYIKKNMNEPSSYEHVKTTYDDKGDYLLVITTFRGKNSLGQKVIEKVSAKADVEGNILSVEKL
jgi:hypothetical protein